MKSLRDAKPFFFENSKVPVFMEKFAPINISAISLFGFVFSKGTMSERVKRHEVIHFQQQLETGMVGFLFIYLWDYAKNRFVKKMDGPEAYLNLRAEQEAYEWDHDEEYLSTKRKRYEWLFKYKDNAGEAENTSEEHRDEVGAERSEAVENVNA